MPLWRDDLSSRTGEIRREQWCSDPGQGNKCKGCASGPAEDQQGRQCGEERLGGQITEASGNHSLVWNLIPSVWKAIGGLWVVAELFPVASMWRADWGPNDASGNRQQPTARVQVRGGVARGRRKKRRWRMGEEWEGRTREAVPALQIYFVLGCIF